MASEEVIKNATAKCYRCKWNENDRQDVPDCYCECMQSVIEDIDWDEWEEELAEENGLCPEFQEE